MAVIDQQKHYTAIEDLVPDGYSILELEEGDLNRDSCKDAVVILARNGEEEEEKAPKRPTLLLLGQPDHTYKITARNDKSVMSAMAGGMEGEALKGIIIKEGYFSFEYFGRMPGGVEWEYTVTFKYDRMDSGHWFLHRDGLTVYRDLKPVSNKMKTTKDFGKVFFEQFDVDKDFESMMR